MLFVLEGNCCEHFPFKRDSGHKRQMESKVTESFITQRMWLQLGSQRPCCSPLSKIYPHSNRYQWAGPAAKTLPILTIHSCRESGETMVKGVCGRLFLKQRGPRKAELGVLHYCPQLANKEKSSNSSSHTCPSWEKAGFSLLSLTAFLSWASHIQSQNNRLDRAPFSISAVGRLL